MARKRWFAGGALLGVLALAASAFAHGGEYQPPAPVGRTPEPPTPPNAPSGPPTLGGGDGGPATPSGPAPRGPATPGGPFDPNRPKPRTSGGAPTQHWTHWWYANRPFLVDWRGRVAEREASTPSADGKPGPDKEAWKKEAQRALTAALADPDEDVSSGAAIALGKFGDPSATVALLAVMGDTARQQPVREAAALALGLLQPDADTARGERVRVALESTATGKSPERLRAFAVYALGLRADVASLPFLVDTAQAASASWDVPAAAATALGLSGSNLIREDLEGLFAGGRRAKEFMRRVYAANGLVRLGDVDAVPLLRAALREDDEDVRRASLLALGVLARADDGATAEQIAHVMREDRDRACRAMAALALGRSASDRALRELRWDYNNGDSMEQPFAALALGLLARRAKDVSIVAQLRRDFAERANSDLRGALAIALGLAGDVEAAPMLRTFASERGDPEVLTHVATALGLLGDRGSAPVLRTMLKDAPAPSMQREAALSLGMLGDREAVRILLELIDRGDGVYVQGSAAVALGRIGGEETSGALVALLRDGRRPGIARGMAAVGLGRLLDRTEGRSLALICADLDWYALTPAAREILDIL